MITTLILILLSLMSEQKNCKFQLPGNFSAKNIDICSSLTLEVVNNINLNTSIEVKESNEFILQGARNRVTCYNYSGIIITGVKRVIINDITLVGCGAEKTQNNIIFLSAVSIINCNTSIICDTIFEKSVGTGLVVTNFIQLNISDSLFQHGRLPELRKNTTIGGGGAYLELFCENSSSQEVYAGVKNCNFSDNQASTYNESFSCTTGLFSGLGFGGGLSVRLQNCSNRAQVEVYSSIFSRNLASWGGGMELVLCSNKNSDFLIFDVTFLENEATNGGGGGVDMYVAGKNKNNNITIDSTRFSENKALHGGGTVVGAKYTSSDCSKNSIKFLKCLWDSNVALYGSALDIYPSRQSDGGGAIPNVSMSNCNFIGNCNCDVPLTSTSSSVLRTGFGTVMVTGFKVSFSETNTFTNNSGSSIYATGSQLFFHSNSMSIFENNKAIYGAGIALIGVSMMIIDVDCTFIFTNNTARLFGAGIFYYTINKHAFVHPNQDFFQVDQASRNYSFNFSNNCSPKDPRYLSGVFSEDSIHSFNQNYSGQIMLHAKSECSKNPPPVVNSLCNGSGNVQNSIIQYHCIDKDIYFIPGIERQLQISTPPIIFRVLIYQKGAENITFSENNAFIKNNIIFYGDINATASVFLLSNSFDDATANFDAHLTSCPPFYKLSEKKGCQCCHDNEYHYNINFDCYVNNTSYSSVSNGYWVDYDEPPHAGVLVGICPVGFCKDSGDNFKISLPFSLDGDLQKLEKSVCHDRIGVLCGECIPGKVVHYHSSTFKCKDNQHCHLGPLLFILAELLPVTIVLFLLIFLDISLTHGGAYGFIFFAQAYVLIEKDAKVSIIYQLFNFDFFEINSLSFCLWSKATTLDLLIIKYAVSVYSLFLILSVVGLVKFSSRFKWLKLTLGSYSLVKVLSAFLLIVYSKCTYTSLHILGFQKLYNGNTYRYTRVALQGNMKYFGIQHAPYACTALLILIFVSLLFPIMLLFYPLCNRIVSFLSLEDNPAILLVSQLLPLHKFLPFFDSFQGSFKEKYRFFAGLYFIYRIIILSSLFATTKNATYLIVVILAIVMISIQTLVWPYKSKGHNITDTLLFANLGLICCCKLLNSTATNGIPTAKYFYYAVELVLVSIPIGVGLIWVIWKGVAVSKKIKNAKKKDVNCRHDSFLLDNIRDESYSDYSRMISSNNNN